MGIDVSEELRLKQGDGEDEIVFQRRGEAVRLDEAQQITIAANVPCMPAIVSVVPPDSRYVRVVRPLLESLQATRYYPLFMESSPDLQRSIVRQSQYNRWLARRGGAGDFGADVVMRLLEMTLTRKEKTSEIEELLGPSGLGVIDRIQVRSFPVTGRQTEDDKWHFVTFQPSLQQEFFSLDDLSSGTQRLIGILTALIYDRSAVMLLEHPEDSIHRALLWKLIKLLQSRSEWSQLIISSHSAVVFNAVAPEAIRLVTMGDGATNVRSLTDREVQSAGRYLDEEGTLGDFLEMVEQE